MSTKKGSIVKIDSILTGDEVDIHYPIGPDPHGIMIGDDAHGPVNATGCGHSKAHVKHDPDTPMPQMKLTKQEQDIMDGKQGEVLAKVMKTVVAFGNVFGADKLVDLGGNPHRFSCLPTTRWHRSSISSKNVPMRA